MISSDISKNKTTVKNIFSADDNIDFNFREFKICFKNSVADAFLIYYDGMSNQTYLNRDIMRSLLTCKEYDAAERPPKDIIAEQILAVAPLTVTESMDYVGERVSYGECAIFVDGCGCAFVADIKGWDSRGVDSPTQEISLSGPQEAFNESIMTNLALVRKILKNPNVTATNIPVGNTSKTPCALMYIKGITNQAIVDEVERRLKGIDTEYIYSSSDVEMLIEDSTYFPLT
ncbi:MAG: spore germination protein, partial [Clostridiales bacterium]|nr:spore germination protein [Clostridiales bacterium]